MVWLSDRQRLLPEEIRDAAILGVGAAALGLVGDCRLVGDIDRDGHDVADLTRALILEESARAVSPQ